MKVALTIEVYSGMIVLEEENSPNTSEFVLQEACINSDSNLIVMPYLFLTHETYHEVFA